MQVSIHMCEGAIGEHEMSLCDIVTAVDSVKLDSPWAPATQYAQQISSWWITVKHLAIGHAAWVQTISRM